MKQTVRFSKLTTVFTALILALGMMVPLAAVSAQQTQSTNYQLNEVYFGTGGELDACSTNYCSKQSAGELTVGNTKGTAYQAQAGFNTDRTEYLEIGIGSTNVDLGVLTTGSTGSGTTTFYVKSYLAHGYAVHTYGTAPTNSGHTLTPMTGAASSVGTEQFGMNLAANNVGTASPSTFGAAPSQDPDATFSFGTASTGYGTANSFKYASGDKIAESLSSSGYTNYTISYIANISGVTPGGTYTMNQSLVATSTF